MLSSPFSELVEIESLSPSTAVAVSVLKAVIVTMKNASLDISFKLTGII